MVKFAIKNAYYDGKTVGYLYYDENKRVIPPERQDIEQILDLWGMMV